MEATCRISLQGLPDPRYRTEEPVSALQPNSRLVLLIARGSSGAAEKDPRNKAVRWEGSQACQAVICLWLVC